MILAVALAAPTKFFPAADVFPMAGFLSDLKAAIKVAL